MKPVQNRETLPSSLNVFCWLWLLDQEGGSGPTGLKYSRKLNRLDDIVLFTVADRESFLLVCLSLLFPLFFFLSALLSELPHLLLRTQIICIWRDSWLVCCGWNFIFWKAVTLAVTSLDAWVSGLWAKSWCYILWLKNPPKQSIFRDVSQKSRFESLEPHSFIYLLSFLFVLVIVFSFQKFNS